MLSLVSWFAGACELTGLWVIGFKNKWGFILNMIGGVAWIAVAVFGLPATGLLLVVIPALILNTRNFFKWRRQEGINERYNIIKSGK